MTVDSIERLKHRDVSFASRFFEPTLLCESRFVLLRSRVSQKQIALITVVRYKVAVEGVIEDIVIFTMYIFTFLNLM